MVDFFLKEGVIQTPKSLGERAYLVGSKCRICGYVCFPKKEVCIRCRRDDVMEEIKLSNHGTLENFAVMQIGPSDFPLPYIIGYVKTKEGVLIFTQITGCEAKDEALQIGEEMEMVIEMIKTDDYGNNLIGWKFKPIRQKLS